MELPSIKTSDLNLIKTGDHLWSASSLLMWSPRGVEIYNRLQDNAEYKDNITSQEINFLKSRAETLKYFLPESFTIIDCGPGDGDKSILLIKELSNTSDIKYIGIDISAEMLALAQADFAGNNINGSFYCEDFVAALPDIRKRVEGDCLIAILGLTPFSDPERNLKITESTKVGDRIFLTFEPRERMDINRERQSYGSEKAMEFHKATLGQLGLELGVHVDNLEITDEIGVYVTVKQLTDNLKAQGVSEGDKIRIGYSYRPMIEELAALFEKKGFMANIIDDGGKFAGVMLVPKPFQAKSDIDVPNLEDTHPFKKHFEGESGHQAFNRMVDGSLELFPHLKTFFKEGDILEVGPFYNPLVTPERFPHARITYLDRDKQALNYLKNDHNETKYFEFGVSDPKELLEIPLQDAIVTSHIITHIGTPNIVEALGSRLKKGGILFMNESIDYGGDLMHPKRPKSIEEILSSLRSNGFIVLSYRIIPTPNEQFQPHPRLVLAAKKL